MSRYRSICKPPFFNSLLGRIANAMVVTVAVTCCVGAILGGFQALGLRKLLAAPRWWVLATVLGVGVGLAAGVVIVEQAGILATGTRPNIGRLTLPFRTLSLFVVGLATGTALGCAQALVLRRQIPRVKGWAFSSALGLATAFAASSLLVDSVGLRFASLPGVIMFVVVSGAAFGVLTSKPLRSAT